MHWLLTRNGEQNISQYRGFIEGKKNLENGKHPNLNKICKVLKIKFFKIRGNQGRASEIKWYQRGKPLRSVNLKVLEGDKKQFVRVRRKSCTMII